MVTHPGTNRARRALTSFTRQTPLTTTPRRQPKGPHRGTPQKLPLLLGGIWAPTQRDSLDPAKSISPTASWLVQPFLYNSGYVQWTTTGMSVAIGHIYSQTRWSAQYWGLITSTHLGRLIHVLYFTLWLGSRVVGVLDSGAEGPGFKSQPRRCRVTVLGKLFTPIVPLFTKQRNW